MCVVDIEHDWFTGRVKEDGRMSGEVLVDGALEAYDDR